MKAITRSRRHARTGRASVAVVASSLLALAGCGAVYTVEPVGEVPSAVDPADWNGYWATPEDAGKCGRSSEDGPTGCLLVTVLDAAQGVLTVVPEGSDVEPARAYLRRADDGNGVFVSLEDWDSDDPVRPLMLLRGVVKVVGPLAGRVVIWSPSAERFREAADAGLLPRGAGPSGGPHGGPTLGVLSQAELELIARTMKWELFDWEAPITYVRVRPPDHSELPSR